MARGPALVEVVASRLLDAGLLALPLKLSGNRGGRLRLQPATLHALPVPPCRHTVSHTGFALAPCTPTATRAEGAANPFTKMCRGAASAMPPTARSGP